MVVTDPKFIATRESITAQGDRLGPPVLQADFGATDPVGLVHAQAKADELEDLLKGMRGGPDDDVLTGGRQRRSGKRQEGTLDLLASRDLNNIMNDILMQQTLDALDDLIALRDEIVELKQALAEWDERNLTAEQRQELAGLPPEQQEAARMRMARENVESGRITESQLAEGARLMRNLDEKEREYKRKAEEFLDEYIDQIRQMGQEYAQLKKRKEDITQQLAENDRLSTRLDEMRAEGETDETRAELDDIIEDRKDLDVQLTGGETYSQRIDAVELAVDRQNVTLSEDLSVVEGEISAAEDFHEKLQGVDPGAAQAYSNYSQSVDGVEVAADDAALGKMSGTNGSWNLALNAEEPLEGQNLADGTPANTDDQPLVIKPFSLET